MEKWSTLSKAHINWTSPLLSKGFSRVYSKVTSGRPKATFCSDALRPALTQVWASEWELFHVTQFPFREGKVLKPPIHVRRPCQLCGATTEKKFLWSLQDTSNPLSMDKFSLMCTIYVLLLGTPQVRAQPLVQRKALIVTMVAEYSFFQTARVHCISCICNRSSLQILAKQRCWNWKSAVLCHQATLTTVISAVQSSFFNLKRAPSVPTLISKQCQRLKLRIEEQL